MAIVPDGFPAWTRTAGISVYGGSLTKTNYQRLGVVNPRTDVGAEGYSRMTADLVAAVRSQPFFGCVYLNNDSPVGAPTIENVFMMTGVLIDSPYEGDLAPTGFPSAARAGDGNVIFTFDDEYTDEYGIAGAFSIRNVRACANGSTYFTPQWEILTATTLRVVCLNAAGSAVLGARVSLWVW